MFCVMVDLSPHGGFEESYGRILAPVLLTFTLVILNCDATLYIPFPRMKLQCQD